MNKLLLLSPFDGLSHRFWREGLSAWLESAMDGLAVSQLALPARHFAWRHRGNSLSFSRDPHLSGDWDLVIATSMTDLAALRGMSRAMRNVPVILYFHENQFAYPGQSLGLLERQMTSIYSALAADHVVFNSEFNRRTFLQGANELLNRMPDEVPHGVVAEIEARSSVIPVALGLETAESFNRIEAPLQIVWNHRWEHDKGPDRLLNIVEGLLRDESDFTLSLVGEQFRQTPEALSTVIKLLNQNDRAGHIGFVESREDYLALLRQHHVVLSTARQEFQGLAVMEGIACGCLPVTPDDMSYPEYVPVQLRYNTEEDAVLTLKEAVHSSRGVPDLHQYHWRRVGPLWQSLLEAMVV